MSKDKGTKNAKKLPAIQIPGKVKNVSAYKSEIKSPGTTLDVFKPKGKFI